jgi:hypothetical protein
MGSDGERALMFDTEIDQRELRLGAVERGEQNSNEQPPSERRAPARHEPNDFHRQERGQPCPRVG